METFERYEDVIRDNEGRVMKEGRGKNIKRTQKGKQRKRTKRQKESKEGRMKDENKIEGEDKRNQGKKRRTKNLQTID